MVSSITYCANPHGDKNDYVFDTLKDFQEEYIWDKPVKNYIQLKYNETMEMPDYGSSDAYKKKYLEGAIKDPVVELLIIPTIEDMKFDGNFDSACCHGLYFLPVKNEFLLKLLANACNYRFSWVYYTQRSVIYMANTTAVYARIDTELKENAEKILSQLGITPSSAIQMLYSQIVLTRGLPLNLHLPSAKPTAIGGMSRAELDAELMKGVESLKSGKTYTADEVDAELAKEFGI